MRDFRDAKTMAQTLRQSLTAKSVTISHSESLELISRILGVADWNTLSAVLHARPAESKTSVAGSAEAAIGYPAIPIRDFVLFPTMSSPLFVGRQKTMQALDHAFQRHREVVLVFQRDEAVDEPAFEDVCDVGVLARLLELERLADGTLKILTQAYRRVSIRRFVSETGSFRAEIADISEGPIPEAPELIERAVKRFGECVKARAFDVTKTWPPLDQMRDPGRVADVIAQHMKLPLNEKQCLLTMVDPVLRLEKVEALLEADFQST